MRPRRAIFTAAVVGAAIGILVLQAVSISIASWYGSAASPVFLVLAPGIVVAGIVNPMYPATYFVVSSIAQAIVYAAVAVGLRALLTRNAREGKDAV